MRKKRAFIACLSVIVMTCLLPSHVVKAASPSVGGGVVLDGYGGLHTFGGFTLNTSGAPYWSGWDIARSVQLLPDGSGGWELDGYGGIHAFGDAPAIATPAYWPGWNIAEDLVVYPTASGYAGYVLDGYGGIHPFGGAPMFSGTPYWSGLDVARGLLINFNSSGTPLGGYELDAWGGLHSFGSAPSIGNLSYYRGKTVYQKLHEVDGTVYAVGLWGIATTISGTLTPNWSGYCDWGDWNITRDIELVSSTGGTGAQTASPQAIASYDAWIESPTTTASPTGVLNMSSDVQTGGVLLDGYGGIHPFGGFKLDTTNAPYWQGRDVAVSLVVEPDGDGGWVLDRYGGIHAFGNAPSVTSPVDFTSPLAQELVCTGTDAAGEVSCVKGYVLDSYGGIHAFGGAASVETPAYWPGIPDAAGLAVNVSSSGSLLGVAVLDIHGGLHVSGTFPAPAVEPAYYPSSDAYQQLHGTETPSYAVEQYGIVDDLTGNTIAPYWSDYPDWGSWDIVRDVVIASMDNPSPTPQPISAGSLIGWENDVYHNTIQVSPVAQIMSLDCETAALQEALLSYGEYVPQSTIFSYENDDLTPAVVESDLVIRWGDPYFGFVGDVWGSEPGYTGYGVYAPEISYIAGLFGHPSTYTLDGTATQVYQAVSEGIPVILWTDTTFTYVAPHYWIAYDSNIVLWNVGEHAVTAVGINYAQDWIEVDNPETGRDQYFSLQQFQSWWASFGDMAVFVG